MTSIDVPYVYNDLLEFMLETATPEQILAFKPSQEAEDRLEELLDRHREGELTPEEVEELNQILQIERVVSLAKARALASLNRS